MGENWDEGGDDMMVEDVEGETLAIAPTAELPEIKLFGRWSCDDVQVSDMSLQVCSTFIFIIIFFRSNVIMNDFVPHLNINFGILLFLY